MKKLKHKTFMYKLCAHTGGYAFVVFVLSSIIYSITNTKDYFGNIVSGNWYYATISLVCILYTISLDLYLIELFANTIRCKNLVNRFVQKYEYRKIKNDKMFAEIVDDAERIVFLFENSLPFLKKEINIFSEVYMAATAEVKTKSATNQAENLRQIATLLDEKVEKENE